MNKKQDVKIRLIAMDMDGTLLNSDQRITQENAKALRFAHERGVHLAVASGRHPQEITGLLEDLFEIPLHILGLNGAFIRLTDGAEQITYLPEDTFSQCVRMAHFWDFRYFFYTDEGLYTNRPDDKERAMKAPGVGEDEALTHARHAVKFVADSSDPARLAAFREEIAALDVSISSSWHTNIEINAKGVGKGVAVQSLAGRLQVPQESVMAAGDQENDLSMLRWAGVPVAMGNAIDEVKRLAVYQTGHHNESGVAQAIYHFLKKE